MFRAVLAQKPYSRYSRRSFHVSRSRLLAKLNVEQLAERVDLHAQNVLVRVDLNAPLAADNNNTIADDTRLRAILPTTQFLFQQQGANVILLSHFGRPNGKIIETGPNGRLTPVVRPLEELLGTAITKLDDCVGDVVEEAVSQLTSGQVVLLENTRFHAGETQNDPQLSAGLGRLADYFVNDAFGTAHRAHSSTVGVTAYTKLNAAGYLMQQELRYLQGAVREHPQRPLMAIVGGAKVSTKIPVLESLLDKCDCVLIGGGMIFTFYKAMGYDVGASLVEDDMTELASQLMKKAEEKGVKLILPVDVVVADAFSNDANSAIAKVTEISGDWRGLDIGPDTVELFKKEIDKAETIVMNGTCSIRCCVRCLPAALT